MWKKIRILILLAILLVVGVNTWRDYHPNWDRPIIVNLHPINADGEADTTRYIQQLNTRDLMQAQQYIKNMSAQYRVQPVNVYFKIGRELSKVPPKVPENPSVLDSIVWSLKFRFYAWQQHQGADGSANVTLFLNYYSPKKTTVLKHSTALENGRIGSINLFASEAQSEQNRVILVHELMHALGAKDKYDLVTGQPHYPEGYAFPDQSPLFPQTKGELMAGHIPTDHSKSVMPQLLNQMIIGPITARELGWKK